MSPFPEYRGMVCQPFGCLRQYTLASFQRNECACLSSLTILAPTNIFNGRTLLYLFNSSFSLPGLVVFSQVTRSISTVGAARNLRSCGCRVIGISVPDGVTVDTGHVPRNNTIPEISRTANTSVHACVTLYLIPIPRSSSARATPFSGVHLLVPLRYVPIECLKVDCVPRRLTSTHYNTTPRRWRAPQSNTGNRDRRTTICKRSRSGSNRSAVFLTETLRLRTTCVVHCALKKLLVRFTSPVFHYSPFRQCSDSP
jgi:hypothetical protein